MIVPTAAVQGGGGRNIIRSAGVVDYFAHPAAAGGCLCLPPWSMDQKSTSLYENDLHTTRHPVLAWPSPPSESNTAPTITLENLLPVQDSESLTTDMQQPSPLVQKVLRTGGVCMSDLLVSSDDEAVSEFLQEGSPSTPFKRGVQAGAFSGQSTGIVNSDEGADHTSTPSEDFTSPRVKFMCSYGGKILPRPGDGRLRYVGGDTRIITVNRDINHAELVLKMTEAYNQHDLTIKYQLPDEDLDALISISSDEDLVNMMEEYDKIERSDGCARLRVFLFSAVDYDAHKSEFVGDQRNTEQRYVDAVNGVPETGSSRKHLEGGVGVGSLMESLIALDVADQRSGNRADSVPMARLGPQIPQEVAPLMQHVPVALPVSSIPGVSSIQPKSRHSAPSSAPSSPPLLARPAKQVVVPDIHHHNFQEQHPKGGGHQYNVAQSEGSYQDVENYGSSGDYLHELLYRNSEPRRASESPTKMHLEGFPMGGHQDEPRRLADVRVPRVHSHGMLTRLSEQHLEGGANTRPESQQLPDMALPPLDLQRRGLHQQHPSGGWLPHTLETQQDNYSRRTDHFQTTSDMVIQPSVLGQQPQSFQQQAQPHFRTGPSVPTATHEGIYRPMDHQNQEEVFNAPFMHRSISSHQIAPHIGSAQVGSYHVGVGSAPSSPRLSYWGGHTGGQQQSQVHRPFNGTNYVEQQHGRRVHPYNDQPSRSFRSSNSPPRYRDHQVHSEERFMRPYHQQTSVNSDQLPHEHVYESNSISQTSYPESVARPQLPHYISQNPYQEGLSGYQDHQDNGEGRWHLFQGKENLALKSGHQHFHPPYYSTRVDYQDQGLPPIETLSGHSRFQEKVSDRGTLHQRKRDVEEARMRLPTRGRLGHSEYQEPDLNGESGATWHLEAMAGSYPHLPDDSDALLAASLGDTYLHRKNDWLEPPGNSNIQSRPSIPQPLAGYSLGLGRASMDGSQGAPHVGRVNETDYYSTLPAARSGDHLQDLRVNPPFVEAPGHHPSVSNLSNSGSQRLLEERAVAGAFNHVAPQFSSYAPNLRMVHSGSSDRLQKLQGVAGVQGRLSRPSSSTNMMALEDEASRAFHGIQASSIGMQGAESLTDDEVIPNASGLHNQLLGDGQPGNTQQLLGSGAFNPPAPQQPSSMISGNVDLPSIVRLEGAVQAYERSGTLDRPPRLPGAIVVQDRLSRPTSGTNVSTLEEESNKGFVGMQAGLSGRQGSDELSEDLMELLDQGLFSQHSVDAQFDSSQYAHATSQMQLPLPSAIKLNTNPIPSVKASVSTESSNMTASVQPPPVYCSTTAGSAVPAHAPTSMVSPAMREGETVSTTAPPATLLSHGEIAGSAVRKADSLQHEDKASLSQLYATGHLAEDMASSVLGSVTKEVEQIHNDGLEDEKEEWMHISQDPSSMVQAPLVSSPTFAIQDWEKDLAELDSDEDESIQEPLAEEKASALQISNLEVTEHVAADVETKELTNQIVEPINQDTEDNSNPGISAAEAEADAISRGLQTIKNADLEEMRELGSGTFGTVYHGKWRGSDVAIKRIKASCFAGRPSEQERLIADFWREACILGQLHHPNVVAFYGVVRDGPGGTLATVTEYMVNGSLKQVLQKKDRYA
jgi:hypothetical protein